MEISGSTLRFEFRGKSGKTHQVALSDRRLARIVARCQALPGADLFQYQDEDGSRVAIGSGDVNDYLREITGEEFTAKDFRTWAGTLQAVAALEALGPAPSERDAKSAILQASTRWPSSSTTPAPCAGSTTCTPRCSRPIRRARCTRRCATAGRRNRPASALSPEEQAVVRLLRHVSGA